MMQRIAEGACPTVQLTARGREMYRLSINVIEFVSAREARPRCQKEGQRNTKQPCRNSLPRLTKRVAKAVHCNVALRRCFWTVFSKLKVGGLSPRDAHQARCRIAGT